MHKHQHLTLTPYATAKFKIAETLERAEPMHYDGALFRSWFRPLRTDELDELDWSVQQLVEEVGLNHSQVLITRERTIGWFSLAAGAICAITKRGQSDFLLAQSATWILRGGGLLSVIYGIYRLMFAKVSAAQKLEGFLVASLELKSALRQDIARVQHEQMSLYLSDLPNGETSRSH